MLDKAIAALDCLTPYTPRWTTSFSPEATTAIAFIIYLAKNFIF